MHAVALGRVRPDLISGAGSDGVVAEVARGVGRSSAEVRQRIALAGDDPVVLGVQRDAERAHATVMSLRAHGLPAMALPIHGAAANLVVARSFVLADDRLRVVSREQHAADLVFAEVDAIVAACRFDRPSPAVEPPQPVAAGHRIAGHAFAAYTQGKVRAPAPSHERVVYLFAGDRSCVLREHDLQYQGLGADLQPSRGANFRTLVRRVRDRCPRAALDERLLRAAAQVHILGPMVAIDVNLELAAALVASVLPRAAADPYR